MSEAYVQLPSDSTGKKARQIQKTKDSETVYERVVVIDHDLKRTITGKYITATPVVSATTASGFVFASIFNPTGSGKLIAIKKYRALCWAVASANYIELATWRITVASAGTLIATTDIAKKDTTLDGTPSAEVRHTNVTVTVAQKVLAQLTAGATAQFPYMGVVLDFAPNEEIILREGEGLATRQEAAGDADQRVVVLIEWEEFTGAPRI
jgi:hypothetical protein